MERKKKVKLDFPKNLKISLPKSKRFAVFQPCTQSGLSTLLNNLPQKITIEIKGKRGRQFDITLLSGDLIVDKGVFLGEFWVRNEQGAIIRASLNLRTGHGKLSR